MKRIDFLRYISLVAISSLSCFSYSQPEYVVNASKPPEPPHSTSIQLSPDRNAEVLIDNFRAYLDASGRVTLVGNGKGKVGHEEGYSYTVDLESETYTTRRLSYSELKEALGSERESLRVDLRPQARQNLPPSPREEIPSAMANQSSASVTITVLTEDPPNIDLAQTFNCVSWNYDGTTAEITGGYRSWWANPQTPLYTTWYIWGTNHTNNYIGQTGSSIHNATWGQYYNYDWLDDDLITWADHYSLITITGTGDFTYDWSAVHGGETQSFLSGSVAISSS